MEEKLQVSGICSFSNNDFLPIKGIIGVALKSSFSDAFNFEKSEILSYGKGLIVY